MDDSAITYEETIDAEMEAKSNNKAKLNDAEANFNENNNLQDIKFLYFINLFINYHCIIDSC